MKSTEIKNDWADYLKFFNDHNAGRPTRLGVFERDSDTDYWLECGLPLKGIDVEFLEERPSVQIMVGDLTHEIKNAFKLTFQLSASGSEDGIDVSGGDGKTTILRFESDG